jgi:hypothetical protein
MMSSEQLVELPLKYGALHSQRHLVACAGPYS